jgi:general nucleoside transport system ATP-binding protein
MELLRARGMTKRFSETATLANDRAGLSLAEGEIRALVGENGAGKSTLARSIAGLLLPDSGELLVRGRKLRLGSVREAEAAGIGFVPQVSLLAQGLTVAENIALGREPRSLGAFLSKRKAYVEAALLLERFGLRIDPDARLGRLGAAERRQVEIVRALARGGEMLILDEPTSLLAEAEVAGLFATLRKLTEAGKAVVLVTHRIEEVMSLADSITVLAAGRVVAEGPASGFDEAELANAMARGRNASASSMARPSAGMGMSESAAIGREDKAGTFELRGIRLRSEAKPLSISIKPGEIVGVAALAGNGLEKLEDYAAGMSRPREGRVMALGSPIEGMDRSSLRSSILAYVPSDREARGLCVSSTIRDNALALRSREFGAAEWLGTRKRDAAVRETLIWTGLEADPRAAASTLSGGNRQRLLLSRELQGSRRIFVMAEPFQGLDLAAQAGLSQRLRAMASLGAAILLLCSNAEDVVAIADRAIALYKGEIAVECRRGEEAALGKIIAGMTGARAGTAA